MSPKVIALIPARKGSQRLPEKNIKIFNGKPLICWTIEEAIKCQFIDEILISTNDPEVVSISASYCREHSRVKGVLRPEELAQDDSTMESVIFHALEGYPFNTIIILLQPTSPLRTVEDIEQALDLYQSLGCAVVSVYREDTLRFKLNGAIYVFTKGYLDLFKKIIGRNFLKIYIMPEDRSIDIDTATDFYRAEQLMKTRLENERRKRT